MTKQRPSDVLFLSTPRTLSNLLVKMLSQQPGWDESGYYLHDAYVWGLGKMSVSPDMEVGEDVRAELLEKLQAGIDAMVAAREKAHKDGNAMFLKSHIGQIWEPSIMYEATHRRQYPSFTLPVPAGQPPRTSPTLLPDELLSSFVPVFLIRHPALIVDSWYRTESRAGLPPSVHLTTRPAGFTLTIARELYEWYASLVAASDADLKPGDEGYPIVVEADDILEGDTVKRLAETVGMDPAQIVEEWEKKSVDGLIPMMKSYVEGIWQSTGVDRSKSSKFLDVKEKYAAWRKDYGQEVGDYLVKVTEESMPAYEFLKSKKM